MVQLLVLFSCSGAFAQDAAPEARYPDRTEIDFLEGIDVNGQLVRPQGVMVVEQKQLQFNPLIRLRPDFDLEIVASMKEIH